MRQQLPPQIKIVYTGRGQKRYQLCVDTSIVNGKHKQIGRNYVYEKDAKDKLASVLNERENGTYVHKRSTTVEETSLNGSPHGPAGAIQRAQAIRTACNRSLPSMAPCPSRN